MVFKRSECWDNLLWPVLRKVARLAGGRSPASFGSPRSRHWGRDAAGRPVPVLTSGLSRSHWPVTWRPPDKGREGHGRDRRTQSRSNAVRASSDPARRLPGAPAPWRRYLGCRSDGTWRRPRLPGSGARCGSGPGRRIQEVAAPPARHLPATLSPAPGTSSPVLPRISPAYVPASCVFSLVTLNFRRSPRPSKPWPRPFPAVALLLEPCPSAAETPQAAS